MTENPTICGTETAVATSQVSALKMRTTMTDRAAAIIVGILVSRRNGLARTTARAMPPASRTSVRSTNPA